MADIFASALLNQQINSYEQISTYYLYETYLTNSTRSFCVISTEERTNSVLEATNFGGTSAAGFSKTVSNKNVMQF